jgi:drug/metabolite transporter (DMT)-like permease
LIYAFYAAILRMRPPIHPTSFLAVGMGLGSVFLLPGMMLEIASERTFAFDAESALSLTYICVLPSLLGYLFLTRGIELVGANRAAPFIHLVPVFGSVLAIGYALVFGGIMLATRR